MPTGYLHDEVTATLTISGSARRRIGRQMGYLIAAGFLDESKVVYVDGWGKSSVKFTGPRWVYELLLSE